MAIKVISVDPSVYKRCTCKNCGSVLEYLPSDKQQGVDVNYTGDKEFYRCIVCPVCDREVRLHGYY